LQRQNKWPGSQGGREAGGAKPAHVAAIVHNGIVSLMVGGKAVAPLVVELLGNTPPERAAAAAEAGVNLFRLNGLGLGWHGPAQFDYGEIEARIGAFLSAIPGASLLLHVCVDPPDWWRRAHPEECAQFLENTEEHRGSVVSWASQRWRNEAGSALTRLIRHIHKTEYGARCIGWQIAAGEAGEWRYSNSRDLPDAGHAMTAHFRQWCAEKYRHNTGILRKAWFDARAEFPAISCPDARERRRGDFGVLRNPQRAKRTLDYYESLSDAQSSAALHFCAQARKACDDRALVGLSYATVTETGAQPEDGHGLPETVMDSPDVQFLANHGAADGSYPRALTGSMAIRGKLLFHATPRNCAPGQAAAVALTHQLGLIVPASIRRETLAGIREAMERALPLSGKGRRRISSIAVVVDMANRYYIAEPADQKNALNTTLLTSQIEQLTRTGAPFDLYLLSDLFHPKFPDYKIVLFLNTFYLSEAERRRVDARVKRSGTTAAWLWGAGLIGEEGVSAEYGRRLFGQKVRVEAGEISLRVRIAESNDPLSWGQHPGAQFGPERAVSPIVTIADKNTTRIGANTDNKTIFSVHRAEEWTSVVFGTSLIPVSLLRNLLRGAGAHLFVDAAEDAIVTADSRSLALTAPRGGQIHISLPGHFDVAEGWSNRNIAQGVSEFTAPVAPGETVYYELIKRGVDAADAKPGDRKPARRSQPPVGG
jgi:hypothetical protein